MATVRNVRVASRVESSALAALVAGQLDAARQLVTEGLAAAVDARERAGLIRLRARLSTWSGPISTEDWTDVVAAAEQLAGTDPELAATMLCDGAVLAAFTRQLPLAEALAERAMSLTGGQGLAGALAATDLGLAHGLAGRREEAVPLLQRADELLEADVPLAQAAELQLHAFLALVVQEKYEVAADTAARFLFAARPLGAVGLLPLPLCLLAHAGWKSARWEEARLGAAEARSLAQASGEVGLELYAEAMLALLAGASGRAEACRRHVRRSLELSDLTGIGSFRVTVQMAQVQLALGLDRPADGLAPLREVAELMGGTRRAGLLHWHADHIDVLAQLGRMEEASAVCARLVEEAPGSRWDSAVLLRCQGQIADDDEEAVALLRASVAALDWQPYEQARSRLRLAQRLAGVGGRGDCPEAAEQAHAAATAFEQLRAASWAAQARALAGDAPPGQRRRAADRQHQPGQGGRRAAELADAVQHGLRVARLEPASAAHLDAGRPTADPPSPPGSSEPVGADARVELRLLGGFTLLRDGAPLPMPAGTSTQAVKAVALAGGRISTDALVEALWPGAEPGRGRSRLRNVLARARRDGVHLERDGEDILLPDGTTVDALVFLDEAAAALAGSGPQAEALARRAVERYAGELLPGDRYQEWTVGPRERVRTRYLQLLDRLASEACGRGDLDQAASWWERALDVDPYDEERYVAAATALSAAGRPGAAHRIVRRGLAAVDRLGVAASEQLTCLAESLRG